jgi:hypothetical protein
MQANGVEIETTLDVLTVVKSKNGLRRIEASSSARRSN